MIVLENLHYEKMKRKLQRTTMQKIRQIKLEVRKKPKLIKILKNKLHTNIMTDVYWNDLQPLKDILDDLEAPNTIVNNKDIEDFKESVCYFVNDILNHNIHIYSDKHFDELLFEAVLQEVKKTYFNAIDLFTFDVEGQVWDAIEIYFYNIMHLDLIAQPLL